MHGSLSEPLQRQLHEFAVDIPAGNDKALAYAAAKFWENGFVLLLGVYDAAQTDALHAACRNVAEKHLLKCTASGIDYGPGRCTMLPEISSKQKEYLGLIRDDAHIQLLAELHGDRWGRFSVTKFGGDFNYNAGCSYWLGTQPLHTDFTQCKPFTPWEGNSDDPPCLHAWQPPAIASSVACHDIGELEGPIRSMTWKQMAEWGSFTSRWVPSLAEELAFESHRPGLVATKIMMPKGSVLIRDVRVFHGGGWNQSPGSWPERVRFLPGIITCGFNFQHSSFYRPARAVPLDYYNEWQQDASVNPALIHYVVKRR